MRGRKNQCQIQDITILNKFTLIGKEIYKHQAIAFKLADMHTEIVLSESKICNTS